MQHKNALLQNDVKRQFPLCVAAGSDQFVKTFYQSKNVIADESTVPSSRLWHIRNKDHVKSSHLPQLSWDSRKFTAKVSQMTNRQSILKTAGMEYGTRNEIAVQDGQTKNYETSQLGSFMQPIAAYSSLRMELDQRRGESAGGLAQNRKNLYQKMHKYQQEIG
jgi:hypothetical protein